ncbi:DNA/RNA-binding protein kin17 [Dionaea muscipula]
MREEEKVKEPSNRKQYWLCEGIVVKVMSKALADKGYYKKKGVVRKVIDKFVGEIEMIDSKHVLRVNQEELETVIPQIGGLVRIVNGAYRGSNARLLAVDTDNFCAKLEIEKGIYDGRVLRDVDYEDVRVWEEKKVFGSREQNPKDEILGADPPPKFVSNGNSSNTIKMVKKDAQSLRTNWIQLDSTVLDQLEV